MQSTYCGEQVHHGQVNPSKMSRNGQRTKRHSATMNLHNSFVDDHNVQHKSMTGNPLMDVNGPCMSLQADIFDLPKTSYSVTSCSSSFNNVGENYLSHVSTGHASATQKYNQGSSSSSRFRSTSESKSGKVSPQKQLSNRAANGKRRPNTESPFGSLTSHRASPPTRLSPEVCFGTPNGAYAGSKFTEAPKPCELPSPPVSWLKGNPGNEWSSVNKEATTSPQTNEISVMEQLTMIAAASNSQLWNALQATTPPRAVRCVV